VAIVGIQRLAFVGNIHSNHSHYRVRPSPFDASVAKTAIQNAYYNAGLFDILTWSLRKVFSAAAEQIVQPFGRGVGHLNTFVCRARKWTASRRQAFAIGKAAELSKHSGTLAIDGMNAQKEQVGEHGVRRKSECEKCQQTRMLVCRDL
jgi:hypothetical protein